MVLEEPLEFWNVPTSTWSHQAFLSSVQLVIFTGSVDIEIGEVPSVLKLLCNGVLLEREGHSAEHNVRVVVDVGSARFNSSDNYVYPQMEFIAAH